jgi:cation diffusion facilitator family transporter
MALTADGWHMATHAGALGLSSLAYWFARTRAHDARFTFGTGKVHALAGYTSAVILAIVAVSMMVESVRRLWHPEAIHFAEALPVAVVGLIVNLASIKLLGHDEHDEHDEHDDDHEDDHGDHAHTHHHDHNHRAAYMHIVADAFTSVLAILALVAGRYAGWSFFDPLMGIVGGIVVLRWGIGLCKSSGRQLVDASSSAEREGRIRTALEAIDDVRVGDLHLWEMGPGRRGCVVSLTTSTPRDAAFYRSCVQRTLAVAHLTVEVHECRDGHERVVA